MIGAFLLPLAWATTQEKPAALSALSTKGQLIVNAQGKQVDLKGVNLGGWLVEEIWMTPWRKQENETAKETVKDHTSLWALINKRFAKEGVQTIRSAWRENWITENDFKTIKSLGMNHVRIPFLHTLLDERGGIERLNWAVATAKKNGLYVVLDMHGTPGGQSNEHHTGQENKNRLWFEVDNIDEMEKKWTALALQFKNEPAVAMYDIMNEPMGVPNPAMLHLVYDRVIRAIRKVDPTKIVVVDDGYKGFETTPHPNLANWNQVVFSLHFYNFDAKAPADHAKKLRDNLSKLKELQGYRNAPIYIGEFQLEPQFSPEGYKDFTTLMTKQNWSWAVWTWKACGYGGPVGNWGLTRPEKSIEAIDPFKDSKEEMVRKIKTYRSENWVLPKATYQL